MQNIIILVVSKSLIEAFVFLHWKLSKFFVKFNWHWTKIWIFLVVLRVKKLFLAASKKYSKFFPFWDWVSNMNIIYNPAPACKSAATKISSDNFNFFEI